MLDTSFKEFLNSLMETKELFVGLHNVLLVYAVKDRAIDAIQRSNLLFCCSLFERDASLAGGWGLGRGGIVCRHDNSLFSDTHLILLSEVQVNKTLSQFCSSLHTMKPGHRFSLTNSHVEQWLYLRVFTINSWSTNFLAVLHWKICYWSNTPGNSMSSDLDPRSKRGEFIITLYPWVLTVKQRLNSKTHKNKIVFLAFGYLLVKN